MNTIKNNFDISIVMPAYNAEMHIRDAIDSIINQSFTNFECLIIDDGSTDTTRDIIRSYSDERIILLENQHDFIASLNLGLETAKGKYIARMDADDIMHPDRLKIQHAIMEAEPSITVCGTWMTYMGDRVPSNKMYRTLSGLIEYPLVDFLLGCFVSHPTTMIRTDFLKKHGLKYNDKYIYAEDYKLWAQIAEKDGVFYIENQSLLFYRLSDTQVSQIKNVEQVEISLKIQNEIIEYLLKIKLSNIPELHYFYEALLKLHETKLLDKKEMIKSLYHILLKNKNHIFNNQTEFPNQLKK